ncbi:hypothetical protein GCM10009680_84580 [Streptomyces yatensis]|uniref:Uncharacterized protein n=1 Tax=Streptomyces yatensis TaxID=155177 RepID=A0ABP4VP81_9ACTN
MLGTSLRRARRAVWLLVRCRVLVFVFAVFGFVVFGFVVFGCGFGFPCSPR